MALIYPLIILLAMLPLYWSQILEEGTSAYDKEPSLEKQLCKQLMQNYTNVGLNGRPISNMSAPIVVGFGLGLIQMDLNERDKILSTSMWSRYTWKDDYLRWSPADWGGIRSVKFSPHEIWKPDIMLYNTAETDSSQREVLAVVGADGSVIWIPHQIFRSSCSIDVTNFPFDRQKCNMYFGSWTHSLQQLDLQQAFPSGIDLSTFMTDYKDSCSWDIINSTAVRNAMPPDNPTMVVLGFTIEMQRKLVFATYMLTLPCVFLASLTLVVFWLPPDRPDRTSLSMSVFASFLILLLILVEAAPPTASSVPTLGIYYCFNMVLIMVSIFLSTLVVNIGRGGDNKTRVPVWLRMFTNILSRILCIHGKVQFMTDRNFNSTEESRGLLIGSDNVGNGHLSGSTFCSSPQSGPGFNTSPYPPDAPVWNKDVGNEYGIFSASRTPNVSQTKPSRSSEIQMEMQEMKGSVQSMMSVIASNIIREQKLKAIKREWASVAMVLDRLFFILYILAITLSLVLTFPKPPSDYATKPLN